jgi:tryptophanyl-tRNA synthetase
MTQYKDKAGAGGASALLGGSAESDQVSVRYSSALLA